MRTVPDLTQGAADTGSTPPGSTFLHIRHLPARLNLTTAGEMLFLQLNQRQALTHFASLASPCSSSNHLPRAPAAPRPLTARSG